MTSTETTKYTPMVRDMPVSERPRERLRNSGPAALSNSELIAILLRTGVEGESVVSMSQGLLSRFGGLRGLAKVSYGELCSIHGVSDTKSCQLLAALELGRRMASLNLEDKARVTSPQDAANLLMAEMSFLEQEHLRVVLLKRVTRHRRQKSMPMGLRRWVLLKPLDGNLHAVVVRRLLLALS